MAYIVASRRRPRARPVLIEVFVDTAPEMLAYLNAKTPLRRRSSRDARLLLRAPVGHPREARAGRVRRAAAVPGADRARRLGRPGGGPVDADVTRRQTTLVEDLSGDAPERRSSARREREDIRAKGAAYIGVAAQGAARPRRRRCGVETPARELVVVDGEVSACGATPAGGADVHRRRAQGRGARLRRLRVEPRDGARVHRLRSEAAVAGHQHRRRSRDGDGGRRQARQHDLVLGQGAMFDPAITRRRRGRRRRCRWAWRPGVDRRQPPGASGSSTRTSPTTTGPRRSATSTPDRPGMPNQPPAWSIFDAAPRSRDADPVGRDRAARRRTGSRQAATVGELGGGDRHRRRRLEATVERFNERRRRGEDPDVPLAPASGPSGAGRSTPWRSVPGHARHQRWPAHQRRRPGPRLRRRRDRRALRRRQHRRRTCSAARYPSGGAPIAAGATFGYIAGRHAAARRPQTITWTRRTDGTDAQPRAPMTSRPNNRRVSGTAKSANHA